MFVEIVAFTTALIRLFLPYLAFIFIVEECHYTLSVLLSTSFSKIAALLKHTFELKFDNKTGNIQ